ncbi:hypothetical protein ES703_123416 [subsurface metagenome]
MTQRNRPPRGRERPSSRTPRPSRKVEQVLSMIRRLTASEVVELAKRLNADPNWPGTEGAPVGAKPKTGPPALSAKAEVKIPKGENE